MLSGVPKPFQSMAPGCSRISADDRKQRVQLLRVLQRHQVVAAANLPVAQEDLRHGGAAARPLPRLGPQAEPWGASNSRKDTPFLTSSALARSQ